MFRGHTERCAGVRCCSTAPYGRFLPSLCQRNDAFLRRKFSRMLPRNHYRCDIGDRILVSMPTISDTFWHYGRQALRQQFVSSCGTTPSTASVYCYADTQMTKLHPVPRHHSSRLEAASLLCWAKERLFFYPRCQGMTRNTCCTFYAAHTASLLVDTEDFFLSFWTVERIFRLENAARSTVIAQVLLIVVAITSIENDILATTFTTAMGLGFDDHWCWFYPLMCALFHANLHKIMYFYTTTKHSWDAHIQAVFTNAEHRTRVMTVTKRSVHCGAFRGHTARHQG
jgi:hypothetical protein